MANAETLFTASRSPPFVSKRIRLKLVEGGSRPVDTRQRGGIRMSNSSNFLPSRSRFRDRRLPFLRFSLCRRRAERATATGVRGDIRRNCEGCEGEGGNDAGNRALRERERGRENSSSLFMSFLFDLLSSRSRFLSRPLDEREYESSERKRRREWEKGRKVAPERVPEISRLPGAEKMRHFSA